MQSCAGNCPLLYKESSIKKLLFDLTEAHLQELKRKGLLPKIK
jgi:hypothetical protein